MHVSDFRLHQWHRFTWRTLLSHGAAIAILVVALVTLPRAAEARGVDSFMAQLSSSENKLFQSYLTAWTFFDAEVDAYWGKVKAKRKARRRKKRSQITKRDYVRTFPPKYSGPKLTKSLQKKWSAHLARGKKKSKKKRRQLPGVSDFLASASKHYGFVPERVPEREFKRRYAAEALRLGLSKTQVVRVYALETGGNGTADMQAGINPITKKGRPISSALGYAQLLHANSVNELRKHGSKFIKRLERKAANANSARRAKLQKKITAVRRMYRTVRNLPDKWSRHVAFAKTSRGRGIHALNLDGDVGPWLQVIKLYGIRKVGKRAGRKNLTSTELELMNLAGPRTGLEMMTPIGRKMPTVNFFSRLGYSRNSIVRGRTGQELLAALGERMDYNVRNKGSKLFFTVFDEVSKERSASR